MKEIQLTQSKVALVDDEGFEELSQFSWHIFKPKKVYYAKRRCRIAGKVQDILMHHQILGKPSTGLVTDHRDGNGLNNQRNNLRFVTNRENCQNRHNTIGSSIFPGVIWEKRTKKWRAGIRKNGKTKWLGRFISEIKAYNAYLQAVKEIDKEESTLFLYDNTKELRNLIRGLKNG